MTADTAGSAVGFFTALGSASTTSPDDLWAGSVGWVDALLRSYYGIYEFTDDLIRRERVYFGQPFAPPAWRARWVERGNAAIA